MITARLHTHNMIFHRTPQSTDLKACRQLASQITTRGAKLYELLGKELELRVGLVWSVSDSLAYLLHFFKLGVQFGTKLPSSQEMRKSALSRSVDVDQLEKGVRHSIAAVEVRMNTNQILAPHCKFTRLLIEILYVHVHQQKWLLC